MKPKLERWVQYGDVIVGYIFDSTDHDQGTRVRTSALRWFDPINREIRCLDGEYILGEEGTYAEHMKPVVHERKIFIAC